MKRICNICKDEKDLNEFGMKGKQQQHTCKPCNRKYQKAHYQANKKDYFEKNKRREIANRAWFKDYKSRLSCSVCPEHHPACLDFHHIDPSKKKWAIAQMVHKISLKSLKDEIAKCVVLCANCHRKKHHEEKLHSSNG